MSSKSLSDRALVKLETLNLTLNSVATVGEAFRSGRTPQRPSTDWRYLQQYLAPDVLLHLHDSSAESRETRYVPGIIVIPSAQVAMAADAVIIQDWLNSNIQKKDVKHGDSFTELETLIDSRIKSRNGKQKARRLLEQLKAILTE